MVEHNRRKAPRVNYPCQLTMWVAQGVYDTVLANAIDVGPRGLGVRLDQKIAVGTKIDIQIEFTDTAVPFRCTGVVVRCLAGADNKFFNIGIQFDPLSEPKQSFLEGKISELIHGEKIRGRSSN